jgi:hypothetical protein
MTEQTQKMSIYFPLALLEQVRRSAKQHKRSFNQEVLWMVEQMLLRLEGESKTEQG